MRAIRMTDNSEDAPITMAVPGPIYAIYHLCPSATPATQFLRVEILRPGGENTILMHAASTSAVVPLATGADGAPVPLFPGPSTVYALNSVYAVVGSLGGSPKHTLIVLTD